MPSKVNKLMIKINTNMRKMITLSTVIIGIILVCILVQELIKRKWLNLGIFNRLVPSKEGFTTAGRPASPLTTGFYTIKRHIIRSEVEMRLISITDHSSTTIPFVASSSNPTYDIGNTLYYSANRNNFYSLVSSREYIIRHLPLGDHGRFKVMSGAELNSRWSQFLRNGSRIGIDGKYEARGLNFRGIKPNGQYKGDRIDAHSSTNQAFQFDNFLNQDIPEIGSICMMAVFDEASNPELYTLYVNHRYTFDSNFFQNLGRRGNYDRDRTRFCNAYRASYAYIGIRISSSRFVRLNHCYQKSSTCSPDGTLHRGGVCETEAYIDKYYVSSGPFASTENAHTVEFVPVTANNFEHHSIPDGIYTVNGKSSNDNFYIAQVNGTIQQYKIFRVNGSGSSRTTTTYDDTYVILSDEYTNTNHIIVRIFTGTGSIFQSNNHELALGVTLRDSENYLNQLDYLMSSSNKYLKAVGTSVSSNNFGDIGAVLRTSSDHRIIKLFKHDSQKYSIVFLTAKKILRINGNTLETIAITDNSNFRSILGGSISSLTDYEDTPTTTYKFTVMPTPDATDNTYIIFTHTSERNTSMTAKNYPINQNIYKYLKMSGNDLTLEITNQFKSGSSLIDDYKFKFDHISDLDATLVNYYRTPIVNNGRYSEQDSINDADVPSVYIHKSIAPHGETDCRFHNIYNTFASRPGMGESEGCSGYEPRYIETVNGNKKLIATQFSYNHNKKLTGTPIQSETGKTVEECRILCEGDQNCEAFVFHDNINDHPVTVSTCELHGSETSLNLAVDSNRNTYLLGALARVERQQQTPVQTRAWSPADRTGIDATCRSISNLSTCNADNRCRYRDGECKAICELLPNNRCQNNNAQTIGSILDFDVTMSIALIGTTQLHIAIDRIELVNPANNFVFPIIKRLFIRFEKGGVSEYQYVSSGAVPRLISRPTTTTTTIPVINQAPTTTQGTVVTGASPARPAISIPSSWPANNSILIGIRAYNGKYISVSASNVVTVNTNDFRHGSSVDLETKITMERHGNHYAFKGNRNNKYVSGGYGRGEWNRGSVQDWERIELVPAGEGKYAFKKHNLYMTQHDNGIHWNASTIDNYQKFTLVDAEIPAPTALITTTTAQSQIASTTTAQAQTASGSEGSADPNRILTVEYSTDYSGQGSEGKLLRPNDYFRIDIPPELCTPNCNELRQYSYKIMFTDIYNNNRTFTPILPADRQQDGTYTYPTRTLMSNSQAQANMQGTGQQI